VGFSSSGIPLLQRSIDQFAIKCRFASQNRNIIVSDLIYSTNITYFSRILFVKLNQELVKSLSTKIHGLVLTASIALLISCNSDDPLPLSTANFEVVSIAPEVGVPVKFENLSFNASAYAWDFGDGNKDSLTIAPEHTYQQRGDYTVRMRAYTDDGQVSEAVQQVSVGERFLTGMFIWSISMVDQNGDPWDDDGSGPDVLFALGPADATTTEELALVFFDSLNVAEGSSTPIGITIDNPGPDGYKLTNEDFVIELFEVDTVDNEASYVPMAAISGFNPVVPSDEFITVTKRADGTGDIVIPYAVLEEYQWYLQFEIL
jgi:hypothetical protein